MSGEGVRGQPPPPRASRNPERNPSGVIHRQGFSRLQRDAHRYFREYRIHESQIAVKVNQPTRVVMSMFDRIQATQYRPQTPLTPSAPQSQSTCDDNMGSCRKRQCENLSGMDSALACAGVKTQCKDRSVRQHPYAMPSAPSTKMATKQFRKQHEVWRHWLYSRGSSYPGAASTLTDHLMRRVRSRHT